MPTTRSRSQPTLQYPRRKSSRAAAAKPQPVARAEPPPSGAVLPLSPRKRLGAENGCNLPPGVLGSPPKQSRLRDPSPARGSRRLSFDENVPCRDAPSPVKPAAPSCPAEVPSSPKLGTPQRACTTPTAKGSPARSPFRCRQETPGSSPAGAQGERRPPVVRLFANDNSRFQQVKQALHTSLPERLLSRDRESAVIRSFLCERVKGRRPGSLYISGAPGTGKTACLTRILQDCREELQGAQCVFINCMTLRSSQAIFALVAERLGAAGGQSQPKDSDRRLEKLVTRPGPMVLLVLDEMDQLDSKAQDVLYTIFEWPWLASSRLCLIGIANALDLTDRILPRLQARPHCRPLLLNFPPYSRQELTAIVQDRLAQVSGEPVLDGVAVQFCARKVSAVSGDARKALDICRRAVEMVESDVRSQKASESKGAPRASLPQVSRVLSEVYGERMAGGEAECFPLQQKLLVCALLLQSQHGKSRELPLGKLHEVYSRLCRQRQVSAVASGECLSLCTLLESRGVFGLKKAKEARLTKVSLKMQEKDVEHALKDKALLGSILAAGLP